MPKTNNMYNNIVSIKETRCTFRLLNYGTNLDRMWQWHIYSKKCWPLKLNLLHPLSRKRRDNQINDTLTTTGLYRRANERRLVNVFKIIYNHRSTLTYVMAHSQHGLFRLWCSLWQCSLLWEQWYTCCAGKYCPLPVQGLVREGVCLRPLDSLDRGFESSLGHGCWSIVFIVCCSALVQRNCNGFVCV